MDLNYLYHRRGVSLFLSRNAASEQARTAHRGLATGYAKRIADFRQAQVAATA
jgi:hypothetical protein